MIQVQDHPSQYDPTQAKSILNCHGIEYDVNESDERSQERVDSLMAYIKFRMTCWDAVRLL